MSSTVAVVIPNFNGEDYLATAIDSILAQNYPNTLIVVENASSDRSDEILASYSDRLVVIKNTTNRGFAGGVNTGIQYALEREFDLIALFNNDAVARPNWLSELVASLNRHDDAGIVTCQIRLGDGKTLDSTGEFYTSWGLPYPRGRDEAVDIYSHEEYVFGASGGASLYRRDLFKSIGLFDEKYFAYYEDTDISFRAQLAGWKIVYVPTAIVDHLQGQTSKKMIRGFTVHQTFKNLPMLFLKNVPARFFLPIGFRFWSAYQLILLNAVSNGNAIPALAGVFAAFLLSPHSFIERRRIQKSKKVSDEYIQSIIIHDLPPNQTGIRKLRKLFLSK